MIPDMINNLQNDGHSPTDLLEEEMENCGFTKEQIHALCLSFNKRGLMVVDVNEELTTPPLKWRTHMWIKGEQR